MDDLYGTISKWLSDPVVVMLLAFIGTTVLLSLIKRLIASRKK